MIFSNAIDKSLSGAYNDICKKFLKTIFLEDYSL